MASAGDTIENPRSGERIEFHVTGAESDGKYFKGRILLAPNGVGPPEHVHAVIEERFHVVTGRLSPRVAGSQGTYGPGEEIVVPPGTPHRWWNDTAEAVELDFHISPALPLDRFLESVFALAHLGLTDPKGLPVRCECLESCAAPGTWYISQSLHSSFRRSSWPPFPWWRGSSGIPASTPIPSPRSLRDRIACRRTRPHAMCHTLRPRRAEATRRPEPPRSAVCRRSRALGCGRARRGRRRWARCSASRSSARHAFAAGPPSTSSLTGSPPRSRRSPAGGRGTCPSGSGRPRGPRGAPWLTRVRSIRRRCVEGGSDGRAVEALSLYSVPNSSASSTSSIAHPRRGVQGSVSAGPWTSGSVAPSASFHASIVRPSGSTTQYSGTPYSR